MFLWFCLYHYICFTLSFNILQVIMYVFYFRSKCCHLFDYDHNDYHDGARDNDTGDSINIYHYDHTDYHDVNQQEAETNASSKTKTNLFDNDKDNDYDNDTDSENNIVLTMSVEKLQMATCLLFSLNINHLLNICLLVMIMVIVVVVVVVVVVILLAGGVVVEKDVVIIQMIITISTIIVISIIFIPTRR